MKVLKMKFGMSGDKVDTHGVRFCGEFDSKVKHLGGISEMISDPDVSPMIKHKRVTFWFIFEKIYPYKKIINFLSQLMVRLRGEGYTIIVSSLDDLVDTTSPEYEGKPESKFPAPDRIHGYNAAGGFSVTAEKIDAKLKFSIEEIETIQELAIKFGHTVYGRSLNKVQR
jgi:hypothetical protein